ncbi:MAG: CHAD domain-containing protein [Kofleriaceae bacterium]
MSTTTPEKPELVKAADVKADAKVEATRVDAKTETKTDTKTDGKVEAVKADGSRGEAIRYPEEDKLGPLGARVSALWDPTNLRKVLVREFNATVAKAKEAAAFVEQSPTIAVHEARKALRRARAVLMMVSNALPKGERRAVRAALQESRRSLSTARDHAVAPEMLASIVLSDEDRSIAKRVLDNAAEALPPTQELKQLLAEAATRAAAQAEALEAALPQELEWKVVIDGIKDVYAEARDARRRGKKSKAWFHTWRRRSKELVYQLELVAEHAGQRMNAIHDELEGIANTQSPAVDLIMLRDFVNTYGQGIAPDAIEHLRDSIDSAVDELMTTARDAGRDAYSQRPKKFAKRLAKAVKRDLTPPDDVDSVSDLAD